MYYMASINYSSYAHAIEKGMNEQNMTGLAKALFSFMCDHEDVVHRRITKRDIAEGNTNRRYIIPDKESIQWYKGQHDVAGTLKVGAADPAIISEAPDYFDDYILGQFLNAQKIEQALNAVRTLVESDNELDDSLKQNWISEFEDRDYGKFLADVFLYAVPQCNRIEKGDRDIVKPKLDDEDEQELIMLEQLLQKHAKPQAITPPLEIDEKEIPYIRQLLMAYADAESVSCIDREDLEVIPEYAKYKRNFERSRRDFYSAETIKESSKEILKINEKDGFDLVKGEVYDGVADVWELYESDDGFNRMLKVMAKASDVHLSANTQRRLLNWIGPAEKKGICHILVGDNKLWWVDNA